MQICKINECNAKLYLKQSEIIDTGKLVLQL